MQAAMLRPLSIKEYLDGEEHAEIRHEYVAGRTYAMAGAKLHPNRIVQNLSASLWQKTRGGDCQVLSSAMKARVATGEATA